VGGCQERGFIVALVNMDVAIDQESLDDAAFAIRPFVRDEALSVLGVPFFRLFQQRRFLQIFQLCRKSSDMVRANTQEYGPMLAFRGQAFTTGRSDHSLGVCGFTNAFQNLTCRAFPAEEFCAP